MTRDKFIVFFSVIYFSCFSQIRSEKVEFIKLFEIGSETMKEELFFQPRGVRTDRKGHIYILDGGDNCLFKFSETGRLLKKAGRKGQGPGEMDNPMGLEIDPEGNIYVNDAFNRRINVYDSDLHTLRTVSIDKFYVRLFHLGNTLLMMSRPTNRVENYFHLFSTEGNHLRSFHNNFHPFAPFPKSDTMTRRLTSIYFFGVADVNRDGTLIGFTHMIPENPMKIALMNTRGEIQKFITKRIAGYDAQDHYEFFKSSFTSIKNYISRWIFGLHFTQRNYLIVQRKDEFFKEGTRDRSLFKLDIFTPEGKCIAEEMECHGNILHIDRNDHVYVLIENEAGFYKVSINSLKISHEKSTVK